MTEADDIRATFRLDFTNAIGVTKSRVRGYGWFGRIALWAFYPIAHIMLIFGILAGYFLTINEISDESQHNTMAATYLLGAAIAASAIFIAFIVHCPVQARLMKMIHPEGSESTVAVSPNGIVTRPQFDKAEYEWPAVDWIDQDRRSTYLHLRGIVSIAVPHSGLPEGVSAADFLDRLSLWHENRS